MTKKKPAASARPQKVSEAPPPPPRRGWIGLLVVSLVTAVILGFWLTNKPASENVGVPSLGSAGQAKGANVVLVTMDAVRADSLGCYGKTPSPTPGLDAIAEAGVRFTDAVTVVPIVLPSHASIMTGQYPDPPRRGHGVRVQALYSLRDQHTTLAEALKGYNYDTAAFIGSLAVMNKHGMHQGFDVYDQELPPVQPSKIGDATPIRTADQVADSAISWIREHTGQPEADRKPFFVWLNFADALEPFNPPAPFKEQFADSPYHGDIAFIDAQVSRVVDLLKETNHWENTLFVATSPCGQTLGEHEGLPAAMSLYETSIAVPLVMHCPKLFPQPLVVDDRVAATVDLLPTICDAVGVLTDAPYQGLSLLGDEVTADRAVYVETYAPRYRRAWSELYALRRLNDKLIDAPTPQYYDLNSDPAEQSNQFSRTGSAGPALKDQLAQTMIAMDVVKPPALAGRPGPETRDPKVMAQNDLVPKIRDLMAKREWTEAGTDCNSVLARNPDDPTVVSLIGRCYEQVDNLESAYRNFARATEIQRFDRHWLDLARICMKLGDLERFEQVANYMRSLDPQDGGVAMLRGKVAQKDGRYAEALTEFDTARTTDPVWQTVPSLTESAVTYVALGDKDAASNAFSDALKVDPDYVPALEGFADWAIESNDWKLATGPLQRLCDRHPHEVRFFNKLAQCLKQSDQDDDAVFVLTSYTLNNPQDPAGFGNLGIVLFQIGRMEEAVYNYYKALELDPNYIFARYNLANTLEYQEDVDGALSEYRQVLERNPAFHDVLIRVLKIHANRQDYDAALAELEAVAKRTSVNWTAIETEPELHLLVQDDRYRALREERAGRSSASQ